MAGSKLVMTEKGRTYTVTGDQVGRALTFFTALSALRTVLAFILGLFGAGGVGVAAAHFLHF
jgi:hypothetical protein